MATLPCSGAWTWHGQCQLSFICQSLSSRGVGAVHTLYSSQSEAWQHSGDGILVQAIDILPESKRWGGICHSNPDFLLCVSFLERNDLPALSRAPFAASDPQACLSPFQSCPAALQGWPLLTALQPSLLLVVSLSLYHSPHHLPFRIKGSWEKWTVAPPNGWNFL